MQRSRRLQHYIDLGHLDEEDAEEDLEAAERDAAMLAEWESEGLEDGDVAKRIQLGKFST